MCRAWHCEQTWVLSIRRVTPTTPHRPHSRPIYTRRRGLCLDRYLTEACLDVISKQKSAGLGFIDEVPGNQVVDQGCEAFEAPPGVAAFLNDRSDARWVLALYR